VEVATYSSSASSVLTLCPQHVVYVTARLLTVDPFVNRSTGLLTGRPDLKLVGGAQSQKAGQ